MIDWTISLGAIINLVTVLGAVVTFIFAIRSDINLLRRDVQDIQHRQDSLDEAFRTLGKILTQVAVQDNRLHMIEKAIDELRHGQGYIRRLKGNTND